MNDGDDTTCNAVQYNTLIKIIRSLLLAWWLIRLVEKNDTDSQERSPQCMWSPDVCSFPYPNSDGSRMKIQKTM